MDEHDNFAEGAPQTTTATDDTILALSFSQIETFTQCPQRWWLVKRANVRRAPGEALILGQAVHQAIEVDLRQRLEHQLPGDLAALTAAFVAAIREQFALEDPTGLIIAIRRDTLEREGIAVMQAYLDQIAPRINPVGVEIPFEFTHPDDASIVFKGRIDAITYRSHTRTIVDWKVIRRRWAIGEEERRLQAAAYLWAEACMEWKPSQQVTFITFPPEWPSQDVVPLRMADYRPTRPSPDKIQMYAQLVRQTAANIRAMDVQGVYPPQPSSRCAWCEVRGACPTGQRYLVDNNIRPQIPTVAAPNHLADSAK